MFGKVLQSIFGSKNERVLKALQPIVARINGLEPEIQRLDDGQLAAKTVEFKGRVAQGETLDSLLPEAFAVVREAGRRVLGMRHFDVQLIGGIILHQGKIAEMRTGEGKTLVATLPVYLNALTGRGVHVVTVNDYLARRDAEWMGQLYTFLGLSVGIIVHGLDDEERKEAYNADITYGTNNEFGFDYLRDNMKFDIESFCQRPFYYAIVDEVDSILIDEARTPLIISGPAEMSTDLYVKVNRIIPKFKKEEHYTIDEKARTVALTEEGVALGEKLLNVDNLYDPRNIEWLHHLNQAMKAHLLFKRDVDYLVRDGQVVIVDEFTGRAMPGRRFSDGLHQALEAKEGGKVENENQTLASITFQNYFRMYEKLAGMTGTADTEAAEFKKIYNLDVTVIPTHNPMVRVDYADAVYKNVQAKYRAIVREIKELHAKGQPVLVGTISIDVSEKIANLLKKEGIPHSVLNAKHHEKEAQIVAEAGQKGRVTIATNMAGRGTDIKLGDGVAELGGLHILGTSRHESRRIDNQLRGRSGRQGDPGSSRFYLSLEDDLLRIFGSDRISGIMERLGMEEDEPIEHAMISRAIENAQRKVVPQYSDRTRRFLHGGLPGFFLSDMRDDRDYSEWMEAFWARDILELFRLERRSSFLKFAELLMAQSGGRFNAASFAASCGVSRPTIMNYLAILEATHLVLVVRPYHGGAAKEIVATPCVYAFDTGFVAWAQGLHEIPAKEKGFFWEHLVLNELEAILQGSPGIMHWRDKEEHEVDFVLAPRGAPPIAIEAKWSADAFEPEGMQAFRALHPGIVNLVVSANVDQPFEREMKGLAVTFCPLSALANLKTGSDPDF